MNKFIRLAVASATFAAVSTPVLAQNFLQNWYLDPDGPGGVAPLFNSEWANFDGYGFVRNTYSSPSSFTFLDDGFFRFSSTDNGAPLYDNTAPPPTYEVTGLFTGATGSGSISGGGGAITFNPGGSLTIYSDTAPDYGTADGNNNIYAGANNGALIGQFTINSGNGFIGPSGLPNGPISMVFQNTAPVACGYFFSGTNFTVGGPDDLCNVTNPFLLAYTTTNASRVTNPPAWAPSELVCDLAGVNCPTGTPFDVGVVGGPVGGVQTFIVGNNGQFRLAVPEPSAIALLGLGLAGLGLRRRNNRA